MPEHSPAPESVAMRIWAQDLRIGHGYDLHRLEPIGPDGQGRPLRIGGVAFEHDRGPVSHSDGDALLHAITDAVLGALALPDIGQMFPDHDPANEARDSAAFVREAMRLVRQRGFEIINLDATVVLERPKLGPRRDEIRRSVARILEIDPEQVNVKGKTHERVDAVGEGRAVEVHCVVLIRKLGPEG